MYIELNEQNIHNYLSKNDEILISNNIKSVLGIFKSIIDNNNKTIYNKNKNYIYIYYLMIIFILKIIFELNK